MCQHSKCAPLCLSVFSDPEQQGDLNFRFLAKSFLQKFFPITARKCCKKHCQELAEWFFPQIQVTRNVIVKVRQKKYN